MQICLALKIESYPLIFIDLLKVFENGYQTVQMYVRHFYMTLTFVLFLSDCIQ